MLTFDEIDKIVERGISSLGTGRMPRTLYEPIEYMLSIGGKRIRPRLCLLTYGLFNDIIGKEILYPALALEIFHEFTLIHDDIMDKSDTRRGMVTVYRKWNENVAILSGDVMSILAYEYISQAPAASRDVALSLFTRTAVQVCEGQQYDMDFEDAPVITINDYLEMIGLKTAVLLACSAKMGAVLANVSSKVADALYNFGYQLGIAFQITDDYLDTFGNEKIFGKKIGGDIMNNKKTWLMADAFRTCDLAQKNRMREIMKLGEKDKSEKVAAMQQLYIDSGVKQNAEKEIIAYHRKAMDAIAGAGFNSQQKEQLDLFAEQLIHREK